MKRNSTSPYIILAAVAAISCGAPSGPRQAPALVLPAVGGGIVDLASFRGKPVLLNFWATWCDSCKQEMPELETLSKRAAGRYAVLGVSMDDNPAKDVPPFAKKYGLTFPLLAADNKAGAAWAVRGLPATFLIDADGRVVRRWLGRLDARVAENDILAVLDRRIP
jgi:peroxiredoxin